MAMDRQAVAAFGQVLSHHNTGPGMISRHRPDSQAGQTPALRAANFSVF
jgi:hypothetical protein